MGNEIILEAKKISKRFPGTLALDDVDFELKRGEVHAIIGENGAGKSTFIKILCGVYQKDSGVLYLDGKEIHFFNSRESTDQGIRVIYQELENLPKLTIAENIFLGRLPKSRKLPGFISWDSLLKKTKELLKKLDIDLNPRSIVGTLSVAQQQLVEIAKALSQNLKILIMDEPTSLLATNETKKLFEIINNLKSVQNVSIIYISHRLKEVIDIADRVTVFRNGKNIGTLEEKDFDENRIINMMIGHGLVEREKYPTRNKEVVLEIKNLHIYKRLYDFNLKLHKGEIIGIAGLIGCGKDEFIKSIFGLWPYQAGEVIYNGKKIKNKEPFEIIARNVVYLPEERKNEALFLSLSVRENLSVLWLHRILKKFFFPKNKEIDFTNEFVKRLSIKVSSTEQLVLNLSGGNQQKVIFARLLAIKPEILLLHDPTRGIDVGSKDEIYNIISKLSESGSSIILLSSEIQEICNLSNRIMVLSKGKIVGEFEGKEINIEKILSCSMSS